MKFTRRIVLTLVAMGLILSIPLLTVGAEKNAKDIYYDSAITNTAATPDEANLGAKFWIEINEGNAFYPVLTSHDFRSGDRFVFKLQPNMKCYVYVFHEGSSGRKGVLFPTRDTGTNNLVGKNRIIKIPTTNTFAMDNRPGEEKLFVVLSQKKLSRFDSIYTNTTNFQGEGFYMISDTESRDLGDFMKAQSKDIIYQADNNASSPAGYAVTPESGVNGVLVYEIILKHR